MSELVRLIERELGVQEMVLTDPLTLRRLKTERIAKAVSDHFAEAHRQIMDAERFARHPVPDIICTFVTQEQADEAVAHMLDAGIPVF